jgi:hypothetical protein
VRAVLLAIALPAFVTPADAEVREVVGQAGVLGEWELTATVTDRSGDNIQEFVGPLKLKHVGVCTQDGPEEKTGELRLRVSELPARVSATLLIEDAECSYTGDLSTSYDGIMNCPNRRGVPLSLWIK